MMNGHDHFLRVARALRGPFTAHDILARTNGAHAKGVASWIVHQARKGVLICVGEIVVPGATGSRPRKAYDFAGVNRETGAQQTKLGDVRRHLWTAMRSLPAFTVCELAAAASTDDLTIVEKSAGNYVRELAANGALICIGEAPRRGGSVKTWRLRPNANTGPRAPKIHRHALIDPNRAPRAPEVRL